MEVPVYDLEYYENVELGKNKNIIYFTFTQFYVYVNIDILVHIIICLFVFFFLAGTSLTIENLPLPS